MWLGSYCIPHGATFKEPAIHKKKGSHLTAQIS